MDIVIDTSAILAVILNEPERDRIIQKVSGSTLIGPGSIPWEMGNAFSAMLKKKRLKLDVAIKGIDIFKQIRIRLIAPYYSDVMKICSDHDTYAYDAYFLECALRFNAPLLTLDKKLKKTAEALNIVVWEV